MVLDPEAAVPLDYIRSSVPLNRVGVEGARRWMDGRPPRVFAERPVCAIADLRLPGRTGPVGARLYRPTGTAPSPAIVFAHSGGWIMGDARSGDPFCARLAERSGCAVLSVDYRLAPEHPYPAGLHDIIDAVRWIAEDGSRHSLDARRVCVAGESSGGNLAAAACLALRDEGQVAPAHQLLVCPVIDPAMDSPSWHRFGRDYSPCAEQMRWMWNLYGPPPADPYAAPLLAQTLSGLPPATILVAEYDPLRDEAEAYGRRLVADGVPTEVRVCSGQIHAVFSYAPVVSRCREILDQTAAALRAALGAGAPE